MGERREIETTGRKSGEAWRAIVWVSTDGHRLFVRSGGGLGRHWPKNLLTKAEGALQMGERKVPFRARHVADVEEARAVSGLVRAKYGSQVKSSAAGETPTPGELATFELQPR